MRVTRAQAHEIPIVLTLIEELLAELGEEGQEFSEIDRERLFRDIHRDVTQAPEDSRFFAFLAWDANGAPVGVLTLAPSFAVYAGGEYGIVQEMYVLPGSRGKKVGKALIDAAVTFARDRGWFRIDVTGPVDDTGRVCRFYERHGFEFAGRKLRRIVPR